jgi:hypothetical protein
MLTVGCLIQVRFRVDEGVGGLAPDVIVFVVDARARVQLARSRVPQHEDVRVVVHEAEIWWAKVRQAELVG